MKYQMKLTKDSRTGKTRFDKVFSLWAGVFLSLAFMKEAGSNSLVWLDYIGYAGGMAGSASPYLIKEFIMAWRGDSTPPDVEPTVATVTLVPPVPGGN